MALIFRNASAQSSQKGSIDFDQNVANIYLVKGGLQASFGNDDHHVQELIIDAGNGALTTSSTEEDGTWTWKVVFTPNLSMKDDSGHKQSSSSSLDLLVMASST